MMTFTTRLLDLLQRYEEAAQAGTPADPAAICAADPDMLPAFAEALSYLDRFRRDYAPETPTPSTVRMADPADHGSGAVPLVPGYELAEKLGEGGMGIVYRALQIRARRPVAVKMLRAGASAATAALARFQTEAEAVARLQHPGIVQVFEIGEHDGLPFFSMEFCPGGSLEQRLRKETLQPGEAATLVRTLALAVQAAHEARVLHRDLKPSNVLLAADGTPKISDFGLAKKLDEQGATRTGEVMGTPAYMPPEQARGSTDLGPWVDVYALGAILYECLTGRPPFRAATAMETLWQVLHNDPVPVRQLNPAVPADLETICQKCLRKEAGKRYGSARELADDLSNFLAGRPIQARPVGLLERSGRWVRRNPLVAGLSAAVVLVLLGGSGVAGYYAIEAGHAADKAGQEADKARAAATAAGISEKKAIQKTAIAKSETYRANVALLASQVKEGLRLVRERDQLQAEEILAEVSGPFANLWEVRLLRGLCQRTAPGFGTDQTCVAVGRDRQFLASGGPGTITLWNLEGQPIRVLTGHTRPVTRLALSRDGKMLVSSSLDGTVKVWDVLAGRLRLTFEGHKNAQARGGLTPQVYCVALSPDDGLVASGDVSGVVRVWDPKTGAEKHVCRGHTGHVYAVAFDPEGKTLYTSSQDATVRTWDVTTGRELATVQKHKDGVLQVAVSARWIASGDQNGTVHVFPRVGGGEARILKGHTGDVTGLAFSDDEKTLASGGLDTKIKLWNPENGAEKGTLRGHRVAVGGVAFGPGGSTRLASAGGSVRWWCLDTRPERRTIAGHIGPVRAVAFSPDNQTFASAGTEGAIVLWDARTGQERSRLAHVHAWNALVAICPDGATLLSSGSFPPEPLKLWNPRARQVLREFAGLAETPDALALRPDGHAVAVVGIQGPVRLRDLRTGEVTLTLKGPAGARVFSLAFSADGTTLAGGNIQGQVTVWDARSGAAKRTLSVRRFPVGQMALSSDGQMLACEGDNNTIRVWDVHTGTAKATCRGHETTLRGVIFSLDGRTLYSGDYKGALKVWDTASGKVQQSFQAHAGPIERMTLSGNGRILATAGGPNGECAIRLWDTTTWQEKARLPLPREVFRTLAFVAGDQALVSVTRETVRRWDAATGWAGEVLAREVGFVSGLAFSPDGKNLISGGTELVQWDVTTGREVRSFAGTGQQSVVFSPDGRTLASTNAKVGRSNAVFLWDALTAEAKGKLPIGPAGIHQLAFSPDGKLAGVGGNRLTVWDPAEHRVLFTVETPDGEYRHVAFSSDGQTLVTNAPEWKKPGGAICLWDPATGQERARLKGHAFRLTGLCPGPDPGTLFSASGEYRLSGEVKLWDLATGQEKLFLPAHAAVVNCMIVSPDGNYLVTGGNDGTLKIWAGPVKGTR